MRIVVGFDLNNPKVKQQIQMAGDDDSRKLMFIGEYLSKVSEGLIGAKVDVAIIEPELEIVSAMKKRKRKSKS